MKYFSYSLSIVALLAATGPTIAEVAEEAPATPAATASGLLMTIRADVNGSSPKTDGFPDPDQFILLGSMPVEPNDNGIFQASTIGESGNLHKVFRTIVHMNWKGGFRVPEDGDFILTMTAREKCANDYKIGGKQFFPIAKKRGSRKKWERSANITGTSKGDFVELDLTDFCKPTRSWKDFEKHTFALDAFFLDSGKSVRLKTYRAGSL